MPYLNSTRILIPSVRPNTMIATMNARIEGVAFSGRHILSAPGWRDIRDQSRSVRPSLGSATCPMISPIGSRGKPLQLAAMVAHTHTHTHTHTHRRPDLGEARSPSRKIAESGNP